MTSSIYSVSDINKYIRSIITQDSKLKFIYIKGEISNFKHGANGHVYFSLKDDVSIVNAAMFSNYSSKLIFNPKDGDEVVVLASVDVYVSRGNYQLIVYEMNQVGQGQILIEFEKLKKQLASEGLFDESRKREINPFPKTIGVITAKNSAAIKDIVFNIKRRYPIAQIIVFYSSVQGEKAPSELLNAFNKSQEYDLDTLIIGRGGGASEDLNAFNDEKLVRAIATSKFPVISAVGHEIDMTLVDFVADKRASTPTAAAELSTSNLYEIESELDTKRDSFKLALKNKLTIIKNDIDSMKENFKSTFDDKLLMIQLDLKSKKQKLELLNPNSILKRGYSMTTNKEGISIKDIKFVNDGDEIVTYIENGRITSEVIKVEKYEKSRKN